MMQLRLRPVPWMVGPALETGVMACVAVLGGGGEHVGQWGRKYFYGGRFAGSLVGRTVKWLLV